MAEEQKATNKAKLALRRKLTFSSAIVGAIVGYASYSINVPLYSLVLMVIVGVLFTLVLGKALKPAPLGGKRWWSSPVLIYVLMWLVVWTILFNMYIVKP